MTNVCLIYIFHFFYPFSFNLPEFLYLKYFFVVSSIVESYFFKIQTDNLCYINGYLDFLQLMWLKI